LKDCVDEMLERKRRQRRERKGEREVLQEGEGAVLKWD